MQPQRDWLGGQKSPNQQEHNPGARLADLTMLSPEHDHSVFSHLAHSEDQNLGCRGKDLSRCD